jgi:lactate dehydrogenase-like 2-hydroxyacid dehydrogenase
MYKAVILDVATLGDGLDFNPLHDLVKLEVFEVTSLNERIERCRECKIIITNKVLLDKELLEECPNLELICITATGLNNVDLDYCRKNSIQVKNVKGYSTNSVAQQTFNLLLNLLSKTRYYDEYTSKGQWENSNIFTHLGRNISEISNKKWGIIGLGEIGSKVAAIAQAFGAEVTYHSASGTNLGRDLPHLSLDEILKSSDIISIHAPLNEFTQNLIGEEELKLMKNGSVLLNLGRGGIINENDLVNQFHKSDILVALDVLEQEPIEKSSRINTLLGSDRFILSPHIAWASLEAREQLLKSIVENVSSFINEDL